MTVEEKVKQMILEEFGRRGVQPPEFVDFMASVIADDHRCTWSAKALRKCVELAVDAYIDEVAERGVAQMQLQKSTRGLREP